jgi:hypothetical protein
MGCIFDLRDGPPWRVDLTWRAWLVICPQFFKIDLFYTAVEGGSGRFRPGSDA